MTTSKRTLCHLFVLLAVGIWMAPSAHATTTQPAQSVAKRPKSWHTSMFKKACGAKDERIVHMLRYDLPSTTAWAGLATAALQAKGGALRGVVLFYKRGKGGVFPGRCATFHRPRCAPPRRKCRLQARAARLFDLNKGQTIRPNAGSWYETPLRVSKGPLKRPAILLQSSFSFGPKGTRQTRTWSSLFSLPHRGRIQPLFRDLSLELWSPKHQALKRLEAGGVRTESLQFRQHRGMPTELVVIKKGIPTALNRCICKRLDQSRRYRLSNLGFRRVHTL